MTEYQSLSHVKWKCKYHNIIWCPKYRRKKLYGKICRRLGEIIRELCRQKGIELMEGHAQSDHVHLCLGIPPKYSVSSIVGFLKGKSAIRLHQEFSRAKNTSKHFWIRGYYVSTVGCNEKIIRASIFAIKSLLINDSRTCQSSNKQWPLPGTLTKPPALPVELHFLCC